MSDIDCTDVDCGENSSYNMDEQTGNLIYPTTVDCDDCTQTLYMVQYDPDTDTWTDLCPESPCHECCDPTCEHEVSIEVLQDPQVWPSGMPTPSGTYPGGVKPSGTVTLECGDISKWVEFDFKKKLTFNTPGNWPWPLPIMRGWTAKRRADEENGLACELVSLDQLKAMAVDALAYAQQKGLLPDVNCLPCSNGKACPKKNGLIWKVTQNMHCTGGSVTTGKRNGVDTLFVNVTVHGRFKAAVWCNPENCGGAQDE